MVGGTDHLNLENLDLQGNCLAVCAHEDGVRLIDISNPASPVISSTIASENAWAVAIQNVYAYIADEDNILIYNVSDISSPFYLSKISTPIKVLVT